MTADSFPKSRNHVPVRDGMRRLAPWGCAFAIEFYHQIEILCRPDRYNLVLHKHLGDVVNVIATKDEFERFYKWPLRFVIRPQHQFLMEMYGIDDYAVFDLDGLVRTNALLRDNYFGSAPSKSDIDRLENDLYQAVFTCVPIKGRPFVCETNTNDFFAYERYWAFRWAANMGLERNFSLRLPDRPPALSAKGARALEELGPLKRLVLIAPEAATASELPADFWNVIADEVHSRGYQVLVNSKRFAIRHGVSAIDLGMTLSDVVSVGYSCAYTFSLRSGLCDALAGIGSRLYAFYPAMLRREGGGLARAFGVPAHEIVIYDWFIDNVDWEGTNLTKILQRQIDVLRYSYEKARFLAKIGSPKRKAARLARKFDLREMAGDGRQSSPERNFQFKHSKRLSDRSYLNGLLTIKSKPERHKDIFIGNLLVFSRRKTKTHFEYKLFRRTAMKHDFRSKFSKKINKRVPPKYDDIFICRHNIGEAFVYLSHLEHWIHLYGSKKPALLVWRERDMSFYQMFVPNTVDLIRIDLSPKDIDQFVDDVTTVGGRRIITGTHNILSKLVAEHSNDSNAHFYGYILNEIGADYSAPVRLAYPRPAIEGSVLDRMKYVDVQKLLLLIPEAISIREISYAFWSQLVEALERRGYFVFVNSSQSDLMYGNAVSEKFNIEELYCLARNARGIIGLASGLSVLLTAAKREMDIIFTDFRSNDCDSAIAKQIYSLRSLPDVNEHLVREYDYALFDDACLIETIISRYPLVL